MKQEIKERWVTALRSGEYKQGYGRLNRTIPPEDQNEETGLCCLGILCEIAYQDKIITRLRADNGVIFYSNYDTYLPPEVKAWAGLDSLSPRVPAGDEDVADEDGWVALASLNDSKEYSFDQIADVIDQHL